MITGGSHGVPEFTPSVSESASPVALRTASNPTLRHWSRVAPVASTSSSDNRVSAAIILPGKRQFDGRYSEEPGSTKLGQLVAGADLSPFRQDAVVEVLRRHGHTAELEPRHGDV